MVSDLTLAAGAQQAAPVPASKPAALTLASGAKPAAFRKLTTRDLMRREAEAARQERATLAAYPDLKKLEGQTGFVDHPDWPDYAGQLDIRVNYWPWLVATWAGEGTLGLEDVLSADADELLACMGAVLHLNPSFRVLFPPLVQRNYPAEVADPNA